MIGLRTNEGGAREKSAVEGERVADLDRRRCGGNGGLFRLLADRETGIALDDGELGTASARIGFSVRPVGLGASRRRDRKGVVEGKSVSGRGDLGGRRFSKKKIVIKESTSTGSRNPRTEK